MQQLDADKIIARAKQALVVNTDKKLAESLGIPRATVASWRRRGSVPVKYLLGLTSEGISLDWLLTGEGPQYSVGDHYSPDESELDRAALWIALNLLTKGLFRAEVEEGKRLSELLDRRRLAYVLDHLSYYYGVILKSKESWEASDLIEKNRVIEALIVEYQLDRDFDYRGDPPTRAWFPGTATHAVSLFARMMDQ